MNPETPDLEARAEALLKRIQRHNLGFDSLTELEVHSLLKEIEAVGNLIARKIRAGFMCAGLREQAGTKREQYGQAIQSKSMADSDRCRPAPGNRIW